jgi:hypothetical protein
MVIQTPSNNAVYASVQRRSKGTIRAIDGFEVYRVTLQECLNSSHSFNPVAPITHNTQPSTHISLAVFNPTALQL